MKFIKGYDNWLNEDKNTNVSSLISNLQSISSNIKEINKSYKQAYNDFNKTIKKNIKGIESILEYFQSILEQKNYALIYRKIFSDNEMSTNVELDSISIGFVKIGNEKYRLYDQSDKEERRLVRDESEYVLDMQAKEWEASSFFNKEQQKLLLLLFNTLNNIPYDLIWPHFRTEIITED